MCSPNNDGGAGDNGKFWRYIGNSGILIFLLGLLCVIVGLPLLIKSYYFSYDGYEIVKDYTDCTSGMDLRYTQQTKCKDVTNEDCSCYIPISITQPMEGPVTLFYELDSYEQTISSYSQSRDDNQLAGHLSLKPADSCGQHTYANTSQGKMPIAPCGQLADAMFNDTFSLQFNNDYVKVVRTGLLSEDEEKEFRNPSGELSEAFKFFSKPINWQRNVWEFNIENPENNGFRYEAFIIWMKTDIKRKPVFRVDGGLQVGNYTLRVIYRYPTSRYEGRRICIISSVRQVVNVVGVSMGYAFMIIGILCFIAGIVIDTRKGERKSSFQRLRSYSADKYTSTRSTLSLLLNSVLRGPTKEAVVGTDEAARPRPPDLEGTQMPLVK